MDFPQGNKFKRPIEERAMDNAKLIQEKLAEMKWKPILKAYAWGVLILAATIFIFVAAVRLALKI